MAKVRPCPFCNIDGEKNRIFYEGANVFAILSNPRLMAGHVLVIPKVHVGAPYQLDGAIQLELFETVLRFQERMVQIFSERWERPAGCDVSWHTRPFMPTTDLTIPGHVHVHLRPRFFQDPLYDVVQRHETNLFQSLTDEERDEYHALLSFQM